MSMNNPHESVKDIVGSVWKNNRPLAISILVIAAAVIFILYKKSQSSLVAPIDVPPTTPGGNLASITYGNITNITKTVTQPGSPTPVPVTSASTAIIRNKQSSGIDKAWDSKYKGVPVRAQPSGNAAVVKLVPFGSTIALLQSSLTAAANQKGGSTQWYPVAGGYLSAWDIASVK